MSAGVQHPLTWHHFFLATYQLKVWPLKRIQRKRLQHQVWYLSEEVIEINEDLLRSPDSDDVQDLVDRLEMLERRCGKIARRSENAERKAIRKRASTKF